MVDVSVIIPTYGKPLYLESAINSVLSQSFKNLELIIVDDNEPGTEAREKTESILKKYSDNKKVCYIQHPRNLNGAAARNTGISKAKGRYISFLDSDDEYTNERIQKCFDLMEQASEKYAGVYTGCEFRRSGKPYRFYRNVYTGNYLLETLACTFMFCTGSNIFIKKAVIDELKGFDTDFLRHQDYEFLVRVFEKYSLLAIPEVLVIKNNENFNLPNVDKMLDIKKQYLNKYSSIIENLPEKDRNYIYHSQFVQLAEASVRAKQIQKAKEFYKKANGYSAMSRKEKIRQIVFFVLNIIR